jgi:chromosome segregation ATPase
LVHEFAHEILHQKPGEENYSKKVKETEAEAVAFVVCSVIGLDPTTASSDYIQIYQGDKETLYRSLEAIRDTARDILAGLLGPTQKTAKDSRSSVPGLEAGSDWEEKRNIETDRRYENMKEELEEGELKMEALENRLAELAAEAGRLQESVFLKRGETEMDHHRKYIYVRMGEIEAQIRQLWRETVFLNAAGSPEVRT